MSLSRAILPQESPAGRRIQSIGRSCVLLSRLTHSLQLAGRTARPKPHRAARVSSSEAAARASMRFILHSRSFEIDTRLGGPRRDPLWGSGPDRWRNAQYAQRWVPLSFLYFNSRRQISWPRIMPSEASSKVFPASLAMERAASLLGWVGTNRTSKHSSIGQRQTLSGRVINNAKRMQTMLPLPSSGRLPRHPQSVRWTRILLQAALPTKRQGLTHLTMTPRHFRCFRLCPQLAPLRHSFLLRRDHRNGTGSFPKSCKLHPTLPCSCSPRVVLVPLRIRRQELRSSTTPTRRHISQLIRIRTTMRILLWFHNKDSNNHQMLGICSMTIRMTQRKWKPTSLSSASSSKWTIWLLMLISYHLENYKRNTQYCLPASLRPSMIQRYVVRNKSRLRS